MNDSLILTIILVLTLVGLVKYQRAAADVFSCAALTCYALGLVTTEQMLSTVTNQGVVTLVLLLCVSFALEKTELIYSLGRGLFKGNSKMAIIKLLSSSSILSSILSNTAVVATLLQPIQRNRRLAPSKLLIPLSYISIAGGTLTLIGTSTNLIVNAQVIENDLPALGFFDFTLIGLGAVAAVSLAILITQRFLPESWEEGSDDHPYFVEAKVTEDSPLVGNTVEQNGLRALEFFFLAEIIRDGRLITPVRPYHRIKSGDRLLFSGDVSKIGTLEIIPGIELFAQKMGLATENLVEVLVKPSSILVGKSLKQVHFRARFDAAVVAVQRQGETISGKLGSIVLRAGDLLTLAMGQDFRSRPNLQRNFFVLSDLETEKVIKGWRQWLCVFGFGASLLFSVITGESLIKPLVFYIAVLIATGTLGTNDIKHRFPYELLTIVISALIIASAFVTTGLSNSIAEVSSGYLAGFSPLVALIVIYLLTLITTELITNNAAAAMMVPIGLSVAAGLGISYLPFVMAVAFAASGSFISPFGYQTNLMVFNAGHYKFKHFILCGLPTSLLYATAVILVIQLTLPF